MRNHSNENEFNLHENELVGETHFQMNGFKTEAKGNSEMAYFVLRSQQHKLKKVTHSVIAFFCSEDDMELPKRS